MGWQDAPVDTTSAATPAWASAPAERRGRRGGDSGAVIPTDRPYENHNAPGFDLVGGLKDTASILANAAAVPVNAGLDLLTGQNNKLAADRQAALEKITTPGAHEFFTGLGNTMPAKAVSHGIETATDALGNVIGKGNAATVKRTVGDVAAIAPGLGEAAPALRELGGVEGPAAAVSPTVGAATAPDKVLEAAGYRTRPSTVANMTGAEGTPSTTAKVAETLGGSEATRADFLKHNRENTNGWGATDIGLPRETVLTPENVAKAEKAPQADYDQVRGAITERKPVSEETANALAATNAPDSLGRNLPGEHANTVSLLSSEPMNAGDLMDRISKLRAEGYKRTAKEPGGKIDPATEAYGEAQIDAANALENELNNRVAAEAPALNGRYQAARKLFAKINVVKRSLKGYNIDPAKVAREGRKSGALDGGLAIIAHAHEHAPGDVSLHVPTASGLTDTAAAAGASGLLGSAIALGTGHPVTGAILATAPIVQYGLRKGLRGTRGEAAASELDATANGPLGNFFGRDDTGFHPSQEQFGLTPPPGTVMEPHQPSVLRSGENVPVAERGGLPPGLTLAPPEGPVIEPHQPSALRSGERVPLAESTQNPRTALKLGQPAEQAFEAHPPVATSSRPLGEEFTAPQHELNLEGGHVGPEPTVPFYHGGKKQLTQFSDEHIGSGEGNQNFSHGHYVGEAEGTGLHYVPEQGGFLTKGEAPKRVVDSMLDLDTPIKDQPGVLKALNVDPKAPVKLNGINPDWTGRELHDALAQGRTNVGPKLGDTLVDSQRATAQWLKSKGIPGAKYADAVSRKTGKGTRNMVFYDPKDAKIVSSTAVKGKPAASGPPKVGGDLTAEDLKLAE